MEAGLRQAGRYQTEKEHAKPLYRMIKVSVFMPKTLVKSIISFVLLMDCQNIFIDLLPVEA